MEDAPAGARGPGHPPQGLRVPLGRLSPLTYHVWETPKPAPAPQGDTARTKASPHSHWRQGHYRRQWYGPRKAPDGTPQRGDRTELNFIRPTFIRGEATEPLTRVYHLRGEKT